jgi:hypothetical protein
MKLRKLWTIIILLILGSVSKTFSQEISVPNAELEKLLGTWVWMKSTGGVAGKTTTPRITGHTQSIEFTKDGIEKIYRDGKQESERKFSFTGVKNKHNNGTEYTITIIGGDNQSVVFHGPDVIFIHDKLPDGFDSTYIRKK